MKPMSLFALFALPLASDRPAAAFLLTELRRHLPAFASLAAVNALCGLFFSIGGNPDFGFASLLAGMAIGIVLPVYLFVDYYREFVLGERVLIHTLPLPTSRLYALKSLVFLLGSLLVWSCGLLDVFLNPVGLYRMRIADSSSPLLGITYLLASKTTGTLCALSLVGLAIAAGKSLRRRALIPAVIAALLMLSIGLLAAPIMGETAHWSIGSSSLQAFPQYAGPLTVSNVFDVTPADINDTIRWHSVLLNLGTALIAGGITRLLLNSRAYEIYGK